MKKTLLIASLVILTGVALVRCGGSGGGTAKDPATEKAQFTDPTGNITSSNATTVMNDALNSTAGNGNAVMGLAGVPSVGKLAVNRTMQQLKPGFRAVTGDVSSCVTGQSETGATIDFGCLVTQGELTNCTGSGTISYVIAGDVMTVNINSLSANCSGEVEFVNVNGQFVFLFSEELLHATAALELWLVCANVTGTVDGKSVSFDGCIGFEGAYANKFTVDGDGGSVVCNSIDKNTDCTKVCAEFTVTGHKTVSVTCDVTKPTTACTSWKEIEEIDNCTVAEAACAL
ncbi:MAG: hypothetical protein V1495_04805 [Pseudomonadota bacterium]